MHTRTPESEPDFIQRNWLPGPGILALLLLVVLSLTFFFPRCDGPEARDLPPETLDPQEVDLSLLTGEPCEPPCWYGITPGLTRDEEMAAILEGLPFFEADTIRWRPGPAITVERKREVVDWGYGSVTVTLQDEVVTTIEVGLFYNVELGDPIDLYGVSTTVVKVPKTPV